MGSPSPQTALDRPPVAGYQLAPKVLKPSSRRADEARLTPIEGLPPALTEKPGVAAGVVSQRVLWVPALLRVEWMEKALLG
eukprot:1104953-Pyramimonas_sp.AAC.1